MYITILRNSFIQFSNLISWKNDLEKLRNTDYIKTYNIIIDKINEIDENINDEEKEKTNKIDES